MNNKKDNGGKIELMFEDINSVTLNKLESFFHFSKPVRDNVGLDIYMPKENGRTDLHIVKYAIQGEMDLKKTDNYFGKILQILDYNYVKN